MQRQTASLRLANGLRVNLVSDPGDSSAAALMRIDAGSYHAAEDWPGLAHLLEHMLFRGSARFPDRQRLMSWIPAQGGRLNATTLATQTAYFFEIDAPRLADGLERLMDMLSAPLLAIDALAQEIGVIDAEYRLLCSDAASLCLAAQQHAFSGIEAMHRFHVGHREAFGDDMAALRRALRQFHTRYYQAGNMTLWLQGPQPLAALRAIAERLSANPVGQTVPPPLPSMALTADGDRRLILPGTPQLRFSFALTHPQASRRAWLRLLECLLTDEAPGSLLAWLRAQEYCDDVQLLHQRCGSDCLLLTLAFVINPDNAAGAERLEAALFAWLQQLPTLRRAQREHYCQLANQALLQQPPLEQLRAAACGLPLISDVDDWPHCIAALLAAPFSRLTVAADGEAPTCSVQGFTLRLATVATQQPPTSTERFGFFNGDLAIPSPTLPSRRVALRHIQPGDVEPVLLLRPAPQTPLDDLTAYRLQSALRPLAAELAHRQGHLALERIDGVWLLQLAGDPPLICHGVQALNQALHAISAASERDALRRWQRAQHLHGELAIRRLLAQLPAALANAVSAEQPRCWQATLSGGNQALHHALAHLLSDFPAPIVAAAPYQTNQQGRVMLTESGDENALLLFYPLSAVGATPRLALRLLAQFYAPRYFQQLRIDRNIGYVVQCAFHRCADREGLLFALQSPRFSVDELAQLTDQFLLQMQTELAQLSPSQLAQAKAALMPTLQHRSEQPLQRARAMLLEDPPAASELTLVDGATLLDWQRRLLPTAP